MTPAKNIRDFPASLHQRLLNLARHRGIGFNLLLQRYTGREMVRPYPPSRSGLQRQRNSGAIHTE